MVENKHPYERVTPSEIVAEAAERVPEARRDEAKQLQKSLEERWLEVEAKRYDVASWLARGLLLTFAGVIVWSGVLIFILLLRSMSAEIDENQIGLVTGFIKDLLPFITTPLGVALGFYFRETRSGQGGI